MTARLTSLLLVVLLATPGLLVARGGKPDDFSSRFVDARFGGLLAPEGKPKPTLLMTIHNKGKSPLWVTLRFTPPAPNPESTLTKKIEPGATEPYSCEQEKVVADAD